MRIILLLIACMVFSRPCKAQEDYRITGNMGQLQQDTLYLIIPSPDGSANVLGVSVLKNGDLEFTGQVPEPVMAMIVTSDGKGRIPLMLENTNYSIRVGLESIEVEGGIEQTVMNEFSSMQREIVQMQLKLEMDMSAAYGDENQMRLQALSEQGQKFMHGIQKRQLEIVKKNANTSAAAYIVLSLSTHTSAEYLRELYNLLGERAKASIYGQMIIAQLTELERIVVGKIAPDFTVYSPEGKPISLYAIQAKVKLVDFWASWCEPCRAENPNLIRLYKKFNIKGLEILSVSLDDDKMKWMQAIAEDKLPWYNGSDLQGQASNIAQKYCIRSIPFILLLDEHNRIIAKNIRGNELTKKIGELLKK